MYHDRYSRRRATDSFHEVEDRTDPRRPPQHWSWMLFLGVFLVQLTNRSIWASFGVITAFLFGDQGPSWLLLTTPTAFAVAWSITEPWVKHLCGRMDSTKEFMYMALAGTTLAWMGGVLSAKCQIDPNYLVPLIGVVGGCGASASATASTNLVRKHFPANSGTVRFFEQIAASMAFFIMPVLSYYIMDTFGDHGGLLMHSGILMQGLIGGALLRGAHWKAAEILNGRPRSFTFREDGDPFLTSSDSGSEEDMRWKVEPEVAQSSSPSLHLESEEQSGNKTWKSLNIQPRLAFGLGEAPDTPPEKRRKRRITYRTLPSIIEDIEEEDSSETFVKEIPSSPLPSPLLSPTNMVQKPPRTFQHVFPSDRVLVTIEGDRRSVTEDSRLNISCDSETGEVQVQPSGSNTRTLPNLKVLSFRERAVNVVQLWSHCLKLLTHPLVAPAAFLQFASKGALLTFASLTPVLLNEYIDDATNMDGAYCICVMGFTWLCFVIASPCFTTIHFSNHQTINVIALCTSSFTLYLVAHSTTLDEVVLYSSLFGLSHGVVRLTNYSVLKICLGSELLEDLTVVLSMIEGGFHLLSLTLVSIWGWGGHLKNLYAVPSSTLLLCAMFWTIQGCVSSVRASRGRHDVTWSRRRRVS